MKIKALGKTLVRERHEFIPPEAHVIAGVFRAQARAARNLSISLTKDMNELNGSWEGRAKNRFMGLMGNVPKNLERFAASLEFKARQIETTKAVEYRWVLR